MNIMYCGYMRTPYARIDARLLAEISTVQIVNLSELMWKHSQIFHYIGKYFVTILPSVPKNDIVWIWSAAYPLMPIFLAAKVFGKPIALNLEGWEVHNDPEVGYGNQGQRIRGYISRWMLAHADVVIVQSDAYVKKVHNLVPEAKTTVLPNCIDLPEVQYPKNDLSVLTAYCKYKNSEKVKGISTFKYAMKQLPFKCKLLTDSPHHILLHEMKCARVYCQLSWTEQFGMAVLEAMSEGCVPVVTDRGNLPDLVGDTGVVVPFGDVTATIAGIRKAMMMNGSLARARAKLFSTERKRRYLKAITESLL